MQYVVDFHNDVTQEQVDAYIQENSGTLVKVWDKIQRIKLIEFPQAPTESSIVESVQVNDVTAFKMLDTSVCETSKYLGMDLVPGLPTHTFSTSDEKDWWKNFVMTTPEFNEPDKTISRKGQHVSVYLMDSGINSSHEEFSDSDIQDVFTITGTDFSDQRGHGTALASIIAGKTCGFTNATVKNVKIFRDTGETLLSEFVDAMNAILNDIDFDKWNIINCSWSVPYNQFLNSLFQDLIDLGVFVVVAAGNSGESIGAVTPASVADAFTIGSVSPDLVPSDFSNYTGGSEISYTHNETNHGTLNAWAPGEMIWAARKDTGYGYVAGTSASAAITSAVFAYSMADFIQESGNKQFFLRSGSTTSNSSAAQLASRGNFDLIDFSDSRYDSSTNVIVGIKNRTPESLEGLFDVHLDTVIWVLKRSDRNYRPGPAVFNMYKFESITFNSESELPEGIKIVNGGLVSEIVSEDLYPVQADLYNKLEVPVTVVEDGESTDRKIVIYFVNDQVDDIEDNDVSLKVSLLQTPCSGSVINDCGLVGYLPTPDCDTGVGCNMGGWICCWEPKLPDCRCYNFA